MKLLYAEDERGLSEAVCDILTYHKYIVDPVYDGEDALHYAQSGQYDGLILDIMMPKMNGLDVLAALRREGCRTPVLLLTAKAEVEDRIAGLDLGADDYLPTPFDMGALLARIRAMLRRPFSEYAEKRAIRKRYVLCAAQAGISSHGATHAASGDLSVFGGTSGAGMGV